MDDKHRFATDEERKIYPEPTIPVIAGTYSGIVRIIGGSKSMWDDLKESENQFQGTDKLCVALSGVVIPDATHLFSWHKKQLSAIKDWRKAEWPDCKALVHTTGRDEYRNIDYVWNFNGGTSVSGLSAIDLAYLLGYRKIILVGVAMDDQGYFYKPMDNPDMHDHDRKNEIRKLSQTYHGIVKSYSGFTKEVFGHPKE